MQLNRSRIVLFAGCLVMWAGCGSRTQEMKPKAPIAAVKPITLEKHDHQRTDEYYWLRERDNPEVIAYLEAENEYTKAVMSHTTAMEDSLFSEIKGRIKQDDSTVPYFKDGYYYYTRYEEGKEYPIYCRKKGTLEAGEDVMLDANLMAEGHEYFAVGSWAVSSENNILAFTTDTVGRRIYSIQFKDLLSGQILSETISRATSNLAWATDNRTLFYTRQDPQTLRWHQVLSHRLGSEPTEDRLVYVEGDETFSCFVYRTKSKKFLMIGSHQTLSSEYRYLEASNPDGEFRVIQPRERKHEYQVDHADGEFYIRTNLDAENFKLVKTPEKATGKNNWQEVIGHRAEVLFEGFELFRDYLVVQERSEGLDQIRIIPWNGGTENYLSFDDPAYTAYIATNPEFDTPWLRYGYSSLTTPSTVYDYNMANRERKLMKQQEVLGGNFSPKNYTSERHFAPARDGAKVPISLVYRNGTALDGSAPLLLSGYGSYGNTARPSFNANILSLLDRGFICAIAHIRGGQEMGRQWYENGKLLKKKNTFTDFIDCAEFLIEQDYTSSDGLFAQGGSAGGLLIGAVINMRPELFNSVVARVPFVDVVTTMLDEDIPLTTSEYDEWGNPNEKVYYDYMLSYSPYDNVQAMDYPNMLVTSGLHDSQVQYWEPTKWVARLRALKADNNILLLKTNMDAGHGGASGRFKRYRETAFEYAFLLDMAGITE